jgi:hypothetical protein
MMMLIEPVQHECVQDAMPDFDVMKKFMEDDGKVGICEQEIMKNREFQSRQDKRDAQRTKRSVQDRLSRRWERHLNLDESFRAPCHFTWRY